MMSIERIELEIQPADVPIEGEFEQVIWDFEDQLIEPGGTRIKQIELDVRVESFLQSVFYEKRPIGLQFEFHPGGAMSWGVESSDQIFLEPNAPIYSVMIGGIVGVILNFLFFYWGKSNYVQDGNERKVIVNIVNRLSWSQFGFGTLVSLVAIFLLRASDNPIRAKIEGAGFVAFDFSSGVIIGLSFLVIAQILMAFFVPKGSRAGMSPNNLVGG